MSDPVRPGAPLVRAARLVDAIIRRGRLRPREALRVRHELESHLADGLEAGEPLDALLDGFGDPHLQGRLIGRAQRRQRSPWSRVRGWVVGTVGVSCVILVTGYAVSGARLWKVSPAPPDWAALSAGPHLVDSLSEILSTPRPPHGAALQDAITTLDASPWAGATLAMLRACATWLERESAPPQCARSPAEVLTVLRQRMGKLVAALYAGDATNQHPSARGLRLVARLKGRGPPTLRALLLEPIYFAAPLPRGDLERDLERVFTRAREAGRVALIDDPASVAFVVRVLAAQVDSARTLSRRLAEVGGSDPRAAAVDGASM